MPAVAHARGSPGRAAAIWPANKQSRLRWRAYRDEPPLTEGSHRCPMTVCRLRKCSIKYSPAFLRLRIRTSFSIRSSARFPQAWSRFRWSRTGLDRVLAELRLEPGEHLLDLCCGRGGIGLWFASVSGARLSGVDFSAVPPAPAF